MASDPRLIEFGAEMRHEPTPAEETMWRLLRNRRLAGYKFRRQHPIGPYIADFYAASAAPSASCCARRACTCCSTRGGGWRRGTRTHRWLWSASALTGPGWKSLAGERVIFTGAMDHAQLQQLVPCAELVVVPSVLPEAFGMVAAEAASCGLMTVVSDHSGLAEVAACCGPPSAMFDGSVDDLERAVGSVMDMPAADRDAIGLLGRERVCARWSWERIADRLIAGVPHNDEGDSGAR